MNNILSKIYIQHYAKLSERKKYIDLILQSNEFFKNKTELIISDESLDSYYIENNKYLKNEELSRSLKNSEICIAEQMLSIFEKIVESSNDICLILEDDFYLTENFNFYIEEFLKNLPESFDCIFMSSCCNLTPSHNNCVNSYFYEEKTSRCTTAFLINKSACEKILKIKNYTFPIDWHLNAIQKELSLKFYWTDPIIVLQGSEQNIYKSNIR